MSTMLHRLLQDDAGQDMVEYALLCSLISIAGLAALSALGPKIMKVWYIVGSKMP